MTVDRVRVALRGVGERRRAAAMGDARRDGLRERTDRRLDGVRSALARSTARGPRPRTR